MQHIKHQSRYYVGDIIITEIVLVPVSHLVPVNPAPHEQKFPSDIFVNMSKQSPSFLQVAVVQTLLTNKQKLVT